jgi:hypothetical protein
VSHSPLRNDADPEWREMHRAAEQREASLSRLLTAAFGALAARTVLLRIRAALQYGNVEAAIQAVPVMDLLLLRSAIQEAMERTAQAGARIGLEASPQRFGAKAAPPEVEIAVGVSGRIVARLGTSAGLPVAELAYWARQRAAALVVGITEQTRRAIRETIAQAIQDGLSPARAAKLVENVVGLNTVQARALAKRAAELVERGVSASRREATLARYAARLRRQRAQVIARHELMQAANAGRRAQWAANVKDGVILPERWEREWVGIVPSDGRTCRYCIGQDGQRAPINGNYPDGSSGPPGHTLCRCTESLVRAGEETPGRVTEIAPATGEELDALDKYTQSWHGQINRELRGGAPATLEGADRVVAGLDALAAKGPLTEPKVLYRGVGQGNPVASLDVGELRKLRGTVTEELGFASTSTEAATAVKFTSSATPVVLEIHVPAGTRVIDVVKALEKQLADDAAAGRVPSAAASESEFILARGYRFRVGEVFENFFPSEFLGGLARHKLILYLIP